MRRKIFALCDLEADYAVRFMDYLNQKKNIPFEIQAFTSVERLEEFAAGEHIELLLISGKAMNRNIRELDIGKIVILSDGGTEPKLSAYPSVYKYQSTSEVVREVMACYGEEARPKDLFPGIRHHTELIGVYSPLKRCLRTSFALTLGQILAESRKTLYLNLEEYAGFEKLMGRKFPAGMSELLYFAGQEMTNLPDRIRGMIQPLGSLDFVPPVKNPWDIRGSEWEMWDRILTQLEQDGFYQVVVLDIGSEIDELFTMLKRCSRIYMPCLEDKVSRSKLSEYETLLKEWGCGEVLEKTVRLRLPDLPESGGDRYAERLVYGPLGDYVRELAGNG